MNFMVRDNDEGNHSEKPALEQLHKMGYTYKSKSELNKERQRTNQVLLYDILQKSIKRINPELDDDGINDAINQIKEDTYPYTYDVMDTNQKIHAKMAGLSQTGGLEPITVEQYDQNGLTPKTVKLFDFENIENNDFTVTNQFELQGFKNPIYPDIILFVNGFPLVVIECKSPFRPNWLEDAVEKENFRKYRSTGNGYERLMFYNHILVATCGTYARHGTISSDVNHFQNSRWSSAKLSKQQIKEKFGDNREQEILIAGMLNKKTLLDLLQNYVIYQTISSKPVKIIAKHQQYRATEKCIQKIKTETSRHGGVIWHTQGSGKSFTMQWVAKQAVKYGNHPLVIVTDRRQLDKQIHTVFSQAGFVDPQRASKSSELEDFIKHPKGKTIMSTIQKFEEIQSTTHERIIVLVDEAHRSQFGIGAGAMDKAIPNGLYFAFSGTPIDREDKSTFKVFGNLIDSYGFEESKKDGSTIPIKYIGRMPNLFVEGEEDIEKLFDRMILEPNMSEQLKEELKAKYVNKEDIIKAPQRIKKITLDIIEHYTNYIEPDGYKAMIVTSSREAAIQYKKELDRLNAPQSKIIMVQKLGDTGRDGNNWDKYYLSDADKRRAEESFKTKEDPTKILIVVDMLLVGFDAPILKVLYLDKGLKEHNLLQAIARVNRPYDGIKSEGIVIDYYGVTKNIKKALEIFGDDVKGAWEADDNLDELELDYNDIMQLVNKLDINESNKIIIEFKPADKRAEFDVLFKKFAKTLNSQMYKKESVKYIPDFKFLCKVKYLLKNAYEHPKLSTIQYAAKIQQLIDDSVRASGVSELVKPMDITYENFLAYVGNLTTAQARVVLLTNKTEQIIKEEYSKNTIYYEELQERLQKIIDQEKQRRFDNAEYLMMEKEIKSIYNKALSQRKEMEKFGFDSNAEFAIYGLIKKYNESAVKITKNLCEKLLLETTIIEWYNKQSVRRKMTSHIYDTCESFNMPEDKIDELSEKILSLMSRGNI